MNRLYFFLGLLISLALGVALNAHAATVTTVPFGGTGFGSYTAGDFLVASSSTLFKKFGVGSEGSILQIIGGMPKYTTHGEGWVYATSTGAALTASTSPTINSFNATSTTLISNITNALRIGTSSESAINYLLHVGNRFASFGANNASASVVIEPFVNYTTAVGQPVFEGLNVSPIATGTAQSLSVTGVDSEPAFLGTGMTGGALWGTYSLPQLTGNSALAWIIGTETGAVINGGTSSSLIGLKSTLTHNAGTVSNAYVGYFGPMTGGTGVVTNAYSVYAETQNQASNNWTFFGAGTGKSYFGGRVGIASSSPSTDLGVVGNIYATGGLGIGKLNTTANTIDFATGGILKIAGANILTANTLGLGITNSTANTVDVASGGSYRINGTDILTATALAASVVSSSLTSLGTIVTGVWHGSVISALYGGTGNATLTQHAVLVGNGTAATTDTGTGSSGQVLISGGSSADPAFGQYQTGVLQSFCTGTFTSASTLYMPAFGGNLTTCAVTTETASTTVAAATFKNLRVNCQTAFKNSLDGLVSVRKNKATTTLACTLNATQRCSDTTHSFTTAEGDQLAISVLATTTEVGASCSFTMEQWKP